MNLFATVHDAQGRVVHNLTKDDFTLEEDGRPQTIRYFSQESGLPLTIGLLVDTSVSQKRLLAEERTASLSLPQPGPPLRIRIARSSFTSIAK